MHGFISVEQYCHQKKNIEETLLVREKTRGEGQGEKKEGGKRRGERGGKGNDSKGKKGR